MFRASRDARDRIAVAPKAASWSCQESIFVRKRASLRTTRGVTTPASPGFTEAAGIDPRNVPYGQRAHRPAGRRDAWTLPEQSGDAGTIASQTPSVGPRRRADVRTDCRP